MAMIDEKSYLLHVPPYLPLEKFNSFTCQKGWTSKQMLTTPVYDFTTYGG